MLSLLRRFEDEPQAGPSGTQRTPSPDPPGSSQGRAARGQVASRLGNDSRPSQPPNRATQIPMSSQMTLVGPVPSQLQNAPRSQQQAVAGPGPKTLEHLRAAQERYSMREEEEEAEGEESVEEPP